MDDGKNEGGFREGEKLELNDVHEKGDGFRDLVKYCESQGVSVPTFFDPVSGETRLRSQDVRGDDFVISTSSSGNSYGFITAVCYPAALERAMNMYRDERDKRRDLYSLMARLKESLNHVVSTWKFTGDGNDPDTKAALQEASDLLDELGEVTYEEDDAE